MQKQVDWLTAQLEAKTEALATERQNAVEARSTLEAQVAQAQVRTSVCIPLKSFPVAHNFSL